MTRLSQAWPLKKLSDLCAIQSGGTPSRTESYAYNGDIPWAKIADLETSDGMVTITEERITPDGLAAIGGRLFPSGTLLLAMYGSVGKIATAGVDLSTNQAILGIQIERRDLIDQAFLRSWLSHHQPNLVACARGVTQKNISATIVRDLEIPLPPLPEQRRIASILDKADAIRRKRRETLRLADDFLRSVFLDMFGDPLANPKGWPMGVIGDLASAVQYGTSAKAGSEGAFPVLRMGNITYEGNWDFTDLKYMDLTLEEQERYLVRKGEVLFNRTNSRELVGKTAVYREERPMAYAGYLVKLTVNAAGDGEYVAAVMNTTSVKAYLRAKCKNIIGMANINASEFKSIPVPLPPVGLQRRFAAVVNQVLAARRRLEGGNSAASDLFTSLSQRAFRGDL